MSNTKRRGILPVMKKGKAGSIKQGRKTWWFEVHLPKWIRTSDPSHRSRDAL